MSVMLYKHPGKHNIHNDKFDYIIVDEEDVENKIKEGWYLTTTEALNPIKLTVKETVKITKPRKKKNELD